MIPLHRVSLDHPKPIFTAYCRADTIHLPKHDISDYLKILETTEGSGYGHHEGSGDTATASTADAAWNSFGGLDLGELPGDGRDDTTTTTITTTAVLNGPLSGLADLLYG